VPDKKFYISARAKEDTWKKKVVTPRVAVVGLVESPDRTKLLIIKRKYPPHGYAFPGGMMDLGETIEETAVREIKEETGIDAEALGLLNVTSHPEHDPRWHVVVPHLVMRAITDKEPKGSDDAEEAFWMNYKDPKLSKLLIETSSLSLEDYSRWREKEWKLIEPR
jgi:8-oxo-dGTP diphosphatase